VIWSVGRKLGPGQQALLKIFNYWGYEIWLTAGVPCAVPGAGKVSRWWPTDLRPRPASAHWGSGWLRASSRPGPQGAQRFCMEGQGSRGVLLTIEVFSKTSPLRVPFMGPATPVQFMPSGANVRRSKMIV